MQTIHITYTIFDTIEVPDNLTDDEIQDECRDHWYDVEMNYSDLEWDRVEY